MVRKFGIKLPRIISDVLAVLSVTQTPTPGVKTPFFWGRAFSVTTTDYVAPGYTFLGVQARPVGTSEWLFIMPTGMGINFSGSALYPGDKFSIAGLADLDGLTRLGRLVLVNGVWKWSYLEQINDRDVYEFRAVAYQTGEHVLNTLVTSSAVEGPAPYDIRSSTAVRRCFGANNCVADTFDHVGRNELHFLSPVHPLAAVLSAYDCSSVCSSAGGTDVVTINLQFGLPGGFKYLRETDSFALVAAPARWMDPVICANSGTFKGPPLTFNFIGAIAPIVDNPPTPLANDPSTWPRYTKFAATRSLTTRPNFNLLVGSAAPLYYDEAQHYQKHIETGFTISSRITITTAEKFVTANGQSISTNFINNSNGLFVNAVPVTIVPPKTIIKNEEGVWAYSDTGAQLADGEVVGHTVNYTISFQPNHASVGNASRFALYGTFVAVPEAPCGSAVCGATWTFTDDKFAETYEPYPPVFSSSGFSVIRWLLTQTYSLVLSGPPVDFVAGKHFNWVPGFPAALGGCYFWARDTSIKAVITDGSVDTHPDICSREYHRMRVMWIDCAQKRVVDVTASVIVPGPDFDPDYRQKRDPRGPWYDFKLTWNQDINAEISGEFTPEEIFNMRKGPGTCPVDALLEPDSFFDREYVVWGDDSAGLDSVPNPATATDTAVSVAQPWFPTWNDTACPGFTNFYNPPGKYGTRFLPVERYGGPGNINYSVSLKRGSTIVFNAPEYNTYSASLNPSPSPTALNINDSNIAFPFHGEHRQRGALTCNFLMPNTETNCWEFDLAQRQLMEITVGGNGITVAPTYCAIGINDVAQTCCPLDDAPAGNCVEVEIKVPLPAEYLELIGYHEKFTYGRPNALGIDIKTAFGDSTKAEIAQVCRYIAEYGTNPGCVPIPASTDCVASIADVDKSVIYVLTQRSESCISSQRQLLCGTPPLPVWGYQINDDYVNFPARISRGAGGSVTLPPQTYVGAVFFSPPAISDSTLTQMPITVRGMDALPVRPTQARLELHFKTKYPADLRIILRSPEGRVFFDSGMSAITPSSYSGLGGFLGTNYYGSDSVPPLEWFEPIWFAFHTYFFAQHCTFDGDWTVEVYDARVGSAVDLKTIRLGFLTDSAAYLELPPGYGPPAPPTDVLAEFVTVNGEQFVQLSWTPPVVPADIPAAQLAKFQYTWLRVLEAWPPVYTVDVAELTNPLLIPMSVWGGMPYLVFRVAYRNSLEWSKEANSNILFPSAPPGPSAPRGVVLACGASRSVTAYWGKPANADETEIESYRVKWTVTIAEESTTTWTDYLPAHRRWAAIYNQPAGATITAAVYAYSPGVFRADGTIGPPLASPPGAAAYSLVMPEVIPPAAELTVLSTSSTGLPASASVHATRGVAASEGDYYAFLQYSDDGGETWAPALNYRPTTLPAENKINSSNMIVTLTAQMPEYGAYGVLYRVRAWIGRGDQPTINGILSYPVSIQTSLG